MEKILCAAIHYDNHINYPHMDCYGINTGFVLCGYRHHNIIGVLPENTESKITIERAKELNIDWPVDNTDITQGFVTSTGRFVDREEAAKIALDSGQINELKYSKTKLFSEDLY